MGGWCNLPSTIFQLLPQGLSNLKKISSPTIKKSPLKSLIPIPLLIFTYHLLKLREANLFIAISPLFKWREMYWKLGMMISSPLYTGRRLATSLRLLSRNELSHDVKDNVWFARELLVSRFMPMELICSVTDVGKSGTSSVTANWSAVSKCAGTLRWLDPILLS